jgi:hypothetical protein
MYPANFFGLFPPFPRDNKIFVAMSFDEPFKKRWQTVLEPAIKYVVMNDVPLEAVRVDARRIGDSIITEILDGISRHQMVIADVTTIGHLPAKDGEKDLRPIRNANVMYEVGLAHAVRLPEEILMFRSDSDDLSFDIANIRVNHYDPDNNPEDAKKLVTESIISALRELDLKRHLAVRQAVDSLDHTTWWILSQAQAGQGIKHPTMRSMGDALGNTDQVRAIAKLLDIGAIKAEFPKITPEIIEGIGDFTFEDIISYRLTGFGKAIFFESTNRMNIQSKEMQDYFKRKSLLNNEKEQRPEINGADQ